MSALVRIKTLSIFIALLAGFALFGCGGGGGGGSASTTTSTSSTSTTAVPGWTAGTIDSLSGSGVYTSIKIDSENIIHVAYGRYNHYSGIKQLKYASCEASGSTWRLVTIEASNAGGFASLVLDSNKKNHIIYLNNNDYGGMFDVPSGAIKYATDSGGTWSAETIENLSDSAYLGLGIDSSDTLYMVYCNALNNDLRYGYGTSGSWTLATIDARSDSGYSGSIAVEDVDKVHIINRNYVSGYKVIHNTNRSGLWVSAEAGSAMLHIGHSTALVKSGTLLYACFTKNSDLAYATAEINGSNWISDYYLSSTVDDVEDYLSLAIDQNGKTHICYCSDDAGQLKYITNQSGSWVITTLDSANTAFCSIAVDSSRRPYIVYYDVNADCLKYIKKN
jgi:hypothetical protein